MATSVIMPALEMAQESGTLVRWLKREGEAVSKGEALMEIETDKVTVEIEAPASGNLGGVSVREGEAVPVGQTIAWILAPGEAVPAAAAHPVQTGRTGGQRAPAGVKPVPAQTMSIPQAPTARSASSTSVVEASPLARRMAEEYGIDLGRVGSSGRRIERADVETYVRAHLGHGDARAVAPSRTLYRLAPASPKARRLAAERNVAISALRGSGPEGAVLAADVLEAPAAARAEPMSTVWRLMAERMTHAWTSVPHFYLMRDVDASALMRWRQDVAGAVEKETGVKPTYTDLMVKLIGLTLREHARLNSSWSEAGIVWNEEINVGIAVGVEDGLIVPVLRTADRASVAEIARQRADLVSRAQGRKLKPADLAGGTFTLTNLGMYGVDGFNAIVNTPQAAILALGRIADRVVPVDGKPAVRPMLTMTLSCDHRLVDGLRGAQFLDALAKLVENAGSHSA